MTNDDRISSTFKSSADEIANRLELEMNKVLQESTFSLREKVALGCRMLADEGHARTLAGQVSARAEKRGTFWTTNFGAGFADARTSNLVRVDGDLNVVEGEGMANPAVRFHLWIYEARPDINSIVHTHPPYASALSIIGEELAVAHMDATPFHGDCAFLAEWPGIPLANEEGRIICEALGEKRSILLANHGLLTTGRIIEEAVYLAILFEQAARTQITARSVAAIRPVRPELAKESHDFMIKHKVIVATFSYWARQTLRKYDDVLR
jgi:L-fuculose-phosphate aldolase